MRALLVGTLAGLVLGALHSRALWRHAHGPDAGRWGAGGRLVFIGSALTSAALVGQLMTVVAGWTAGLALTAVVLSVSRSWK